MPGEQPPAYLTSRLRGPRAPRLLLVDDDEVMRRSTVRFLSRAGFEVIAVPSGLEAIALVDADERFDVGVVDLEMPGMDGVTLIRALHDRHPGLPLGLWSASQRLDELSAADLEHAAFVKEKNRPIGELVQAACFAVYSRVREHGASGETGATGSGGSGVRHGAASSGGSRARPASGWMRRDDVRGDIDESTG
jgi:CheY-like chemotaxis protein